MEKKPDFPKGSGEPPRNLLRDEEPSPRLGEWYQDINDFTETKRKIEALIRLKQSLISGDIHDFTVLSEELSRYKRMAMEAVDQLFSATIPSSPNP